MADPITWNATGGAVAAATGVQRSVHYSWPRVLHSMRVILGGGVADTAFVADLEASADEGTTWTKIAEWSLAAGDVSGDAAIVNETPAEYVRVNVLSRSGGTTPTMNIIVTGTGEM